MARDPGRLGCATESIQRGESLIATASRVTRWLLIEQPGPWGREALTESRLDGRIAQTIRSRTRRFGVRAVLIRRPDRSTGTPRRGYLVRSARDGRWLEQLDLSDPEALIDLDLSVLDQPAPPGVGAAVTSSVRLVCTNGRHDPCCADYGRPVVRSLRDEGEDVWESSHVGGDRFAANLVLLPTGVYYGRVPADEAARLIREHDEGLIDLRHYRGRSCFQPLVQAAEIFLRRELDERGIDALRLRSTARADADTAVVVFDHAEASYRATVTREPGGPEHLTCADHGSSTPWRYRLLDLLPVEDPS